MKKISVINDGTYQPKEQRQTGWIVQNCTGKEIDFTAKLMKIGGDSEVNVKFDEVQQFQMKAKEERFIMIGVTAPAIPKNYNCFYQLVVVGNGNGNGNASEDKVCDILELKVCVKSEFGKKKEKKIDQILKMGFSDRKKIIVALKKWNWDDCKAINWLATH